MTTTTATAKKPEQEIHDDGIDDKNTKSNDDATDADRDGQALSVKERKKRAGQTGMNDQLFEVYERIVPLLNNHRSSDAAYKFEIGVEVADVLENHNGYGRGAAKKLAKAIGLDQSAIRNYASVISTWPRDEFDVLMSRKDSRGFRLSFYHLIRMNVGGGLKRRSRKPGQ